jgi:hypothetical protein
VSDLSDLSAPGSAPVPRPSRSAAPPVVAKGQKELGRDPPRFRRGRLPESQRTEEPLKRTASSRKKWALSVLGILFLVLLVPSLMPKMAPAPSQQSYVPALIAPAERPVIVPATPSVPIAPKEEVPPVGADNVLTVPPKHAMPPALPQAEGTTPGNSPADTVPQPPPTSPVSTWTEAGEWIQMVSRPTATVAAELATSYRRQFNNTFVFRYDNGWFVVVRVSNFRPSCPKRDVWM